MIVNPSIETYMLELLPQRQAVLKEMENFGRSINFPLIGPLVGTVLLQLTYLTQAKRILELGSGFGYSAMWFALGLPEDGKVICTDFSAKNKEKAENYFRRAGLEKKLQFLVGDAMEILDAAEGPFDIILNDVQKNRYPEVFEPALNKLRIGGILITDNVLRRGEVAEESNDESVQAIRQFNRIIFQSEKVISSILPIRDGIGVCLKIAN